MFNIMDAMHWLFFRALLTSNVVSKTLFLP